MSKVQLVLVLVSTMITVVRAAAAAGERGPWPAPVEGFRAPAPGEHPRLLFRRSQIDEIRRRAQTEPGKQIVARLRMLLGNDGEKLPDRWNEHFPVNIAAKGHKDANN